jgi:hypothetical protein
MTITQGERITEDIELVIQTIITYTVSVWEKEARFFVRLQTYRLRNYARAEGGFIIPFFLLDEQIRYDY